MSVTASVADGGELSYQWFSNALNSNIGGSPIESAVSATSQNNNPSINRVTGSISSSAVSNNFASSSMTRDSGGESFDALTWLPAERIKT